jgi:hypothetical protein
LHHYGALSRLGADRGEAEDAVVARLDLPSGAMRKLDHRFYRQNYIEGSALNHALLRIDIAYEWARSQDRQPP